MQFRLMNVGTGRMWGAVTDGASYILTVSDDGVWYASAKPFGGAKRTRYLGEYTTRADAEAACQEDEDEDR